jgi:hypothetical protein
MQQGVHLLCAVQPIYDLLKRLVSNAGLGDATSFMSGYGEHAERGMVIDMWPASRGRLSLDEVMRRHGYLTDRTRARSPERSGGKTIPRRASSSNAIGDRETTPTVRWPSR